MMKKVKEKTKFGLTREEEATLRKLNTPIKIQDYLDKLPINFEKTGETYYSPRKVLRLGKAHCLEGAVLAAAALWLQGERPLLLDLKSSDGDDDHVVALYQRNGRWGAISKTNHATLRFRDPIYVTVRELAASYFHEYFLSTTGIKTLESYSRAFSLIPFGTSWVTTEEDLHELVDALDSSPHFPLFPRKNARFIRTADAMERKAGAIVEWTKRDRGT
jgi:hypothetical protein